MQKNAAGFPFLGFGAGLRHCHFEDYLNKKNKEIEWVEALTENYLPWEDEVPRRPYQVLEKIRKDLPVVFHGVSLSIGSVDPLSVSYLKRLKDLAKRFEPIWISDHLCWTGQGGENMHDLFPLPYTKEAMNWVVERISRVQEYLGRRILIENVSSYVAFSDDEMTEQEFISEVAKRADCGILLDINNIYVSSRNHNFDPMDYLKHIPVDRVGQMHLAGHKDKGTHCIDTHDHPVCDSVWDLYRFAAKQFPNVSPMIEWDDHIPEFERLEQEVAKIKRIWKEENDRTAPRKFIETPSHV